MTALRIVRNRQASYVAVGNLGLYFSYETCIAFRHPSTGLVISENVWGATTGRHLNAISPDKNARLPRAEFEKRLEKLLNGLTVLS